MDVIPKFFYDTETMLALQLLVALDVKLIVSKINLQRHWKSSLIFYHHHHLCITVNYNCTDCLKVIRFLHMYKKFENRVLRRIFGPKKDEVTGG
jgi:hypothetical protein